MPATSRAKRGISGAFHDSCRSPGARSGSGAACTGRRRDIAGSGAVGRDGHDAVEWIARQPWSDGHVFMYGGSFVGMTQWHTAAQLPPHLSGIAPYVPIYPGWDVPNTNGIPQAWSAVIMGYISGRMLNDDFIRSDYWREKMLEHYARQASFRTLDEDIGIAQ